MGGNKVKVNQNQQSLIILTDIDLDNQSGASWNRILCYSKAISDAGAKVIITSAKYNTVNKERIEKLENNIFLLKSKSLNYTNKKNLPILKEFKFRSNLNYLREIITELCNINDQGKFLLYPNNLSLSFITFFYLKLFKNKTVYVEKNELHLGRALNLPFPASLLKKLIFPFIWIINLIPGFLTDIIELFFDGMICISTRMEKLYKKLNKNIIRIPILTDTDKTDTIFVQKSNKDCFKIAYTGTISEKRDGVFSFLKSIHSLGNKKPGIIVNLYGPVTNSGKLYLNAIINKYQLLEIVKYHGNLPADEIPEILRAHDLLVLPRPLNLQTNYGFSTKLAEYLNSGVPVLSTKISDSELYLTNEKNIYFTDSLKPKDIASKLNKIIETRSLNIKIAKAAIETHHKHFFLIHILLLIFHIQYVRDLHQ
ncbi:glycosyltransferase family 1 protein [Candidatus Atribacteria bacterium 1244-E10-H5-B2]|nr:MAG: glycosyltransferase family 1 protein [Candidatus Atribacteria bacterium 1244-E10-H5-B2]